MGTDRTFFIGLWPKHMNVSFLYEYVSFSRVSQCYPMCNLEYHIEPKSACYIPLAIDIPLSAQYPVDILSSLISV